MESIIDVFVYLAQSLTCTRRSYTVNSPNRQNVWYFKHDFLFFYTDANVCTASSEKNKNARFGQIYRKKSHSGPGPKIKKRPQVGPTPLRGQQESFPSSPGVLRTTYTRYTCNLTQAQPPLLCHLCICLSALQASAMNHLRSSRATAKPYPKYLPSGYAENWQRTPLVSSTHPSTVHTT